MMIILVQIMIVIFKLELFICGRVFEKGYHSLTIEEERKIVKVDSKSKFICDLAHHFSPKQINPDFNRVIQKLIFKNDH